MKITRRQLRQIIKEELSRLNESMSVDTIEDLESVLKVAYEEGRDSYSPDQRVIGIPGKTEDRPVDPDPHKEVVNTLTSLVRGILDDMSYDDPDTDNDGTLDPDELRDIADDLEGEVSSYDLGREDSFAGIRPQLPDPDYMMGYNEAQMDAGLPTMQSPTDSGRGKKLDPNLLRGALPGKRWGNK